MGLVERTTLIAGITPPLDTILATQLLDEFVSLERRFIQRDWEPAQLDGGQFCEVLARILYHQDSGNLSRDKDVAGCCKYIESDQNPHRIEPRRDALHLIAVLKTVYKFRSQRGGVHISSTYTPNQMDSKFIIEAVRWAMNDSLRIFWTADREHVAKAIREILQFDVPSVGKFEDEILVQRTDLSPEDEIIVLLHFGGEMGFTRRQLGRHARASAPRVTEAIQRICSPQVRRAIKLPSGAYRLTDLGSKYLRENLSDKLLVQ